jgi:hypothetical protein
MSPPRRHTGRAGAGVRERWFRRRDEVGRLHYLRELSDRFEVAAVCDLSRTVVDRVGETDGLERRFTDWTALLQEPLDAVMVLTGGSHNRSPWPRRSPDGMSSSRNRFALSEAEGQAITAAGQTAGVRLMVG